MNARPAELAGAWYPSAAAECERFFDAVEPREAATSDPSAAIVPHAGWVYSGAIAFDALRQLHRTHPEADLVIVFGGHLGPRDPPRLLISGGWQTPFGVAEVAEGLAQDVAMGIECDLESTDEFYEDNAIEVQMPMVKFLWPQAKVLTLGVPPISEAISIGKEVVDLAKARGYRDIVIVGSTDLTHYGPNYAFVSHGRGQTALEWVKNDNDPKVIEAMEKLDAPAVLWTAQRQHNACCPGAPMAAIGAARRLGAERGAVAAYTTSYDVRPSEREPTSFVGYVGMLLGR